ncbi:MAG: nucleotidyltransferase domain-containing protein [Pseudomonadota bacterium]
MNDLVDSHRAELTALCARLHVKRLDIFGSAVRGGFDPAASDLDFLVEFDLLEPAQYADAYFSLKEGLEAIFNRHVDLVTRSSVVNPYFRESIESCRQQLYAA